MILPLLILIAAILAGVAHAQPTRALSLEDQANLVMKIWSDTCAKNFAEPAKIEAFAASSHFEKNPPYAQSVLYGEPGTVWDVSIGPFAQNALILTKDGKCVVLSKHAKSNIVDDTFESVLKGVHTPGVSVQKIVDKEFGDADKGKFRQLAYFLSRVGADTGWVFLATTSDSERAPFQARLTIARSRKP